MKLRAVSWLMLGQMFWLTSACSTLSKQRPVDNWSQSSSQAKQYAAAPRVEASPVDGHHAVSRLTNLESAKPSQRANFGEPTSKAQSTKLKQGPAMMMGDRETAPQGLRDFCQRQPQLCNVTFSQRARPERQSDGFILTGLGPDLTDAPPIQPVVSSKAQPIQAFAVSPQDLAQINQINRHINRAMIGVTDQIAFGRTEFWTMPLSAPEYGSLRKRPLADCEDFALEKRRALIAAGIPEDALYLAVVFSPRTSLHAVLVVATDKGDLVLDNLNDWIVPYQETAYTWIKTQSTTSLLDWAVAGQREQPRSLQLANYETRISTLPRESEAQAPTISMAYVWESTSNNLDMSEPVISSIRPTGGRSK